jgi:hypothetical protein
MVNGKKISNPEMKTTRVMNGGATNFVFQATAPGTYQFDITLIIDGQRGTSPCLHAEIAYLQESGREAA